MIKRIRIGIVLLSLTYCLTITAAPQQKTDSTTPKQSKPAQSKQPAEGKVVTISNFKFEPQAITVKAGTVVTWENKEGPHTVTADKGAFESPTLTAGKSFSHTFTKKGVYRYYCAFHGRRGGGDMSGTVTVTR